MMEDDTASSYRREAHALQAQINDGLPTNERRLVIFPSRVDERELLSA
jgi:hypothetical protein